MHTNRASSCPGLWWRSAERREEGSETTSAERTIEPFESLTWRRGPEQIGRVRLLIDAADHEWNRAHLGIFDPIDQRPRDAIAVDDRERSLPERARAGLHGPDERAGIERLSDRAVSLAERAVTIPPPSRRAARSTGAARSEG